MKILIKNGRVIDPSQKLDLKTDLLIEDNKVVSVSKNKTHPAKKIIDAKNKWVVPGLIDIHTHLREPGEERKETIASGTKAAAKGGITSLCCMPNTKPVIDNAPSVEYILLKAQKEGIVNVFPVACITKKQEGKELCEIGVLKSAGAVGISDDGSCVMDSAVMRRVLEYCRMFDIPVISHCEDVNLSAGGVMNEGYMSMVLGLRGIPNASEEIMVARDIILAESTRGYIHIAHVSSAGSVELIRNAKKRGINVTCETAPHYFTLTEEAVGEYDTNAKMYPPLRTKHDVKEIIKGIKDGTIDCIASDHAPHTEEQKNREFDLAPFGIIGLETMLSLSIMELVDKGRMKISDVIAKFTVNPARVMRLNQRGTLKSGSFADITIIDPNKTWKVKDSIVSKSKNTPFLNWTMKGRVIHTIVNGKIIFSS
ncbi:dihydroorotase [bacterium]